MKATKHNQPATSRRETRRARGPRVPQRPGLARSAVSLEPVDGNNWRVVVKGSRALLGTISATGKGNTRMYSWKAVTGAYSTLPQPLQKLAVQAMLERA